MFSAVLDVVSILSIVVLLILALILANAIAMGVRERAHEYAAMRAIGFLPRHVALVVVMESAFVAILGGAVGVFWRAPRSSAAGSEKFSKRILASLFPVFRASPASLAVAFALACVHSVRSRLSFPRSRSHHGPPPSPFEENHLLASLQLLSAVSARKARLSPGSAWRRARHLRAQLGADVVAGHSAHACEKRTRRRRARRAQRLRFGNLEHRRRTRQERRRDYAPGVKRMSTEGRHRSPAREESARPG